MKKIITSLPVCYQKNNYNGNDVTSYFPILYQYLQAVRMLFYLQSGILPTAQQR